MLLDHDLGGQIWVDSNKENTGYQFVKMLVENQLQKNALYYIHSMNPIGSNKVLNMLLDNGFSAPSVASDCTFMFLTPVNARRRR